MSAALRSAVIDIGMSLMLRRARLAFWGGRTGMSSRSVDASGRSPDRRLIQDLVSEARDLWRASPLPHLRERCYGAGGENSAPSLPSQPRWSAPCPNLSI